MSTTPNADSIIKQGAVYYPRKHIERGQTHRRVIGVIQDRVVYCVGGDKNRQCKIATFLRWMRKV